MKRPFAKELTIIFGALLIYAALALAASDGDGLVRVKGLVMDLDLNKSILVVNEKLFTWNQNTVFRSEQGTPINPIEKLHLNTRVYIEAELVGLNKPFLSKKIYLLSNNVGEKRKQPSGTIKK